MCINMSESARVECAPICVWMCTNVSECAPICVWMCTNVSECARQWEPSRVQVGTQRQGPEDRFSQNAAAGCLINSAQHTIVKHTNFCFVRTKCFPLWKVNTTIPANRHHRIFCKANEWCFYSSFVNLVVVWYFMTEYVGLCFAPNSIWDDQLLLKEAIAFFSEGVRARAWSGRRGDGIHRCWKSDERERERDGVTRHGNSPLVHLHHSWGASDTKTITNIKQHMLGFKKYSFLMI